MRLEKIISRGRIVDLRSLDLEGALQELLAVCVDKFPDLKPDALLRGLLAREGTMTTYLGFGVALPHVRVKMARRYVLAIGRSRVGIRHDGALADERVHLIVMLIAGEKARDYLQVLASIARQVKDKDLVENLVNAPDLDALHERLVGGFGGLRAIEAQQNRINRLMFREAERVAKGAGCVALVVFGDTFIGGLQPGVLRSSLKTILVTRNALELLDELETVLGLQSSPVIWPLGNGTSFRGVFDRRSRQVHLFERVPGGKYQAPVSVASLDDPLVREKLDDYTFNEVKEQLAMLDGAGHPFDLEAIRTGRQTPVYFGSAVNNFGIQLLLDGFLHDSVPPAPRRAPTGRAGRGRTAPCRCRSRR